ncbi:MAG: Crp/Fnr family transcriptional regulator [Alphaproteobacteria bacterium]|nr:Crp/Fnr family transcriptional regulator [Alphaproteobacteria bacterium]
MRCRGHLWDAGATIIDRHSEARDVYFVADGLVRVVNFSPAGREIAFDEVGAGGHLRDLAALDGAPRSASVVALGETRTAACAPQTFLAMLHDNPDIALRVTRALARIVRTATDRIMDLSTLDAHNRVHAEILLETRAAMTGANTAAITTIPVHSDIAARASTTLETASRVLGDLSRQGLVTRERDAMSVSDVANMAPLVEAVREQF